MWRTNFDRCLADYGATVAVAGDMNAPTEAAVRQKLGQMRGPSQQAMPSGRAPPTAAAAQADSATCRGSAGSRLTTSLAKQRQQQQQQDPPQTRGTIKAVHADMQHHTAPAVGEECAAGGGASNLGSLHDGSHAVFESLSVNVAGLPEGLAGALQHIVGQLDMLTQVRGWGRKRLQGIAIIGYDILSSVLCMSGAWRLCQEVGASGCSGRQGVYNPCSWHYCKWSCARMWNGNSPHASLLLLHRADCGGDGGAAHNQRGPVQALGSNTCSTATATAAADLPAPP